ncbi:MAG: tyrosine-type recombinase/integrase [Deltaproteobacteria bacterium]|nr:tyrosine-type recombinase/integrase [Deltaproteobacteria bacterium]
MQVSWADREIVSGELVAARSKTEGGTGRIIPLTRQVCQVLSSWIRESVVSEPDAYLFPKHQIGFEGNSRRPLIYGIDRSRPMAQWKSAWKAARRQAGVDFRWHDLRHTFISRLAENPRVSEQTITALAGHVSKRMLERYSHITSSGEARCDLDARVASGMGTKLMGTPG